MKKKFVSLLLVLVFALSLFTTTQASNREREVVDGSLIQMPERENEQELIDRLNALDLIGEFEFFPLEHVNQLNETRDDEIELLYFDSIEDFAAHLNTVSLAFREEWELSISNNGIIHMSPHSSTGWLFDDLSTPSGAFTRFNITVRYLFHPDRIMRGNPPVVSNLSITNSWFTGLQLGSRWTHRHAHVYVGQHTVLRSEYRFSVSGTLYIGAMIGGVGIGVATNEVLTGGFFATHNCPTLTRPRWP